MHRPGNPSSDKQEQAAGLGAVYVQDSPSSATVLYIGVKTEKGGSIPGFSATFTVF